MAGFVLRRIAVSIPTLLVIITAAFLLMRVAPGGPFDLERRLPPEIEANLSAAFNLDQPLAIQYLDYLGDLATGDFGPSFTYRDFTVGDLIRAGAPASLQIGLTALAMALLVGCALGVTAARYQRRPADVAIRTVAMTGIVVPLFVTAPLLALIFGVWLQLLPVAGWNDGALANLILPATALALPLTAVITRLMRASMIEVMREDYIRTAIAKGVSEGSVLWRHGFRAAFMPVLSFLGPAAAGVVTGSVVIEQIFAIPGIGRYFVQGALNRDYTLVMGVVILYAALILILNLAVDIVYRLLDPKVDAEQ